MADRHELGAWLERHTPVAFEHAVWADGTMPLSIATYLGTDLPPLALITSVRSLLLCHDTIMVLRNAHSTHIVPGGRREADESLEHTFERELLEECGWTITSPRLLGCVHFHHLAPKPQGYIYPYPDFFQVVYVSHADTYLPTARLVEDYEQDATFMPIEHVRTLSVTPMETAFLHAAMTSD